MIDTPLLLAISQASATFVAILAGFYTTKILSISSERKKFRSKIKDIDNELRWRAKTVDSLKTEIDNIHNRWAKEAVDQFEKNLVSQPSYYNTINTPEDIKQEYIKRHDLYERSPSEKEIEILESRCSSIIEQIQKNKKERTISVQAFLSQPQAIERVLRNRDEEKNTNKLIGEYNDNQSRILYLGESKAILESDLKFLANPRYVTFGYSSLIIFAVLGVIFPLTYRWWPTYLLNNSEVSGLSAFVIGLVLTLLYIGLELGNALRNEKTYGTTLNKNSMLIRLEKWLLKRKQVKVEESKGGRSLT